MDKLPSDNFISDEQLARLFLLKEGGKSYADALGAIGLAGLSEDARKEVRAIWDLYRVVEDEARAYTADRELLEEIIEHAADLVSEKAEENVTDPKAKSYTHAAAQAGSIAGYLESLRALPFAMAPIALVVIVILAGVGMSDPSDPEIPVATLASEVADESQAPTQNAKSATESFSLSSAPSSAPLAEEDPLDTMFAILTSEAEGDRAILSDAGEDAEFMESDGPELSDMTTAYEPENF